MLNFFKSFPLVQYQFEEDTKDRVVVVDINRNVRAYLNEMDNANAYRYYEINDGARPDQLSMKLYKTPAYYWTFFVINEYLTEGLHAWPKSSLELENYIDQKYDTVAITPESKSGVTGEQHLLWRYQFVVGEDVVGIDSGATGTLQSVDYANNTLYISDVTGTFRDEDIGFLTSSIGLPSDGSYRNIITSGKDAVHHYLDANDNRIDRLQFNEDDTEYPVTNYEYETNENDSKLNIRIINPSAIDEFATRYRSLINK